jgi:predicted HAD superfamily Cof-like phosphohydrolase
MKNYCNMDLKTGYHYGVISLNGVDPEAIYERGHTRSWAEIFNNRAA